MKWLFLSLCLWAASALAAPWGAVVDYMEPRVQNTKAQQPGERYLIPQVLQGRPVKVFLTVLVENKKPEAFEKIIVQSYNRWFQATAQQIRSAKREEEFSDILPLLEKGIKVQFVPEYEQADIEFVIVPVKEVTYYCQGSAGCYRFISDGSLPQIILPQDNLLLRISTLGQFTSAYVGLHETGHSLGLSDQYEQARSTTSHPIYSTDTRKSIMDRARDISCDDADGIINLIDLTRGFSRGGELGWRSLCKKSDIYYVNSAPIQKGPYVIMPIESGKQWRLEVFDQGRKKQEYLLPLNLQNRKIPFNTSTETVLQRDGAGRPVLAKNQQGENIYYSYVYERKVRLVERNGYVTEVALSNPVYSKNKRRGKEKMLLVYFGEEGRVSAIGYIRPFASKGKKGEAFYLSGFNEANKTADITIGFDSKGQIIRKNIFWGKEKGGAAGTSKAILNKTSSFSSREEAPSAKLERKISHSLQNASVSKEREYTIEQLVKWYLRQS